MNVSLELEETLVWEAIFEVVEVFETRSILFTAASNSWPIPTAPLTDSFFWTSVESFPECFSISLEKSTAVCRGLLFLLLLFTSVRLVLASCVQVDVLRIRTHRCEIVPAPAGRRLYSYLLVGETTCWKTPHFQWIYGKLSQIYKKNSDSWFPEGCRPPFNTRSKSSVSLYCSPSL